MKTTTKREQRPAAVCVRCGWNEDDEFYAKFWGCDANGDRLRADCEDDYRLESEPTREYV